MVIQQRIRAENLKKIYQTGKPKQKYLEGGVVERNQSQQTHGFQLG